MRYFPLLLCLVAQASWARTERPDPPCPAPVKPVLFISPMGEPFRPTGDSDDPVRRWFDQADRDHSGTLTIGEMMLDADRFFATLDKDHSGELLPDEVSAYEENIAPEIRLYQRRPDRDGGERPDHEGHGGRRHGGHGERQGRERIATPEGVTGAGRYAFLNIPDPVASADDDVNRAITQREFREAAAERFRDLDPGQTKALTFAALPKTPAQVAANAACLARLKQAAKGRKS